MDHANFTLFNAGRIVAGAGSAARLPELVAELGARRVLVVSDRGVARAGLVDAPRQALAAAGLAVAVLDDTPPATAGRTTSLSASAAGARWTLPSWSRCCSRTR